MAPPRKRNKASHGVETTAPSMLLSDYHTAWLVKSDDQTVDIIAKGETFTVHKSVLTKHSEYFEACLKRQFAEADGVIRFEDVDPKYLGFFLGVAYSYSSIVPHTPPPAAAHPEAGAARRALKDFIEVYKLCDRFLSGSMMEFMVKCIDTSIGDGHRALFRSQTDEDQQKALMRDFADGFEALELGHAVQKEIGQRLIRYFCEGVDYRGWVNWMEEVMDRPRFVGHVSRGFAMKLAEGLATRGKPRRKELNGP